jgi:hypothetical protein
MQVICETIWGTLEVSLLPWVGVTLCSLAATYGIAISVPDIWPVMVRILASSTTEFNGRCPHGAWIC